MKREVTISLSIAAFSLAFLLPSDSWAVSSMAPAAAPSATSNAEQSEAMLMVPAVATLLNNIDARKAKPGQLFQARLSEKIMLKNGSELPRGTELIGTVANDDTHAGGASRLALRCTKAKLKDGMVVPIKATIVGAFPPDSPAGLNQDFWSPQTLQIEDENVISGVDLHSKIADKNSGVFVSTKKDDVRLPSGFDLALAIAAQPGNQRN
jgi:hypothetical protein